VEGWVVAGYDWPKDNVQTLKSYDSCNWGGIDYWVRLPRRVSVYLP